MKAQTSGKYSNPEENTSLKNNQSTSNLERFFNSMSIEEIKKSKPKSRLESFIRRKALEKKKKIAYN